MIFYLQKMMTEVEMLSAETVVPKGRMWGLNSGGCVDVAAISGNVEGGGWMLCPGGHTGTELAISLSHVPSNLFYQPIHLHAGLRSFLSHVTMLDLELGLIVNDGGLEGMLSEVEQFNKESQKIRAEAQVHLKKKASSRRT